ncbi:hypothetical protein [Pseudomonas aeruginosa]|uniref:hypothetical protein n=1 Tax=Pseudomonas aeruginosa TaxID=287 RepID=UPI00233E7E9B|nr:hypothetical protein [Pseudomonas aeruginosa]WCI65284.1 hypothetical protein PMJ94_11335 [Pseudomonas aeruginosa]
MTGFNLDDIEGILANNLEENSSRVTVNETKEANKTVVQSKEKSATDEIAELTNKKKDASFGRVGNGNITKSYHSEIAFKRAKLVMQLDERNPPDAKLNEYLMMLGEELLYAAQRNPELAQLVKNFGIPKP